MFANSPRERIAAVGIYGYSLQRESMPYGIVNRETDWLSIPIAKLTQWEHFSIIGTNF